MVSLEQARFEKAYNAKYKTVPKAEPDYILTEPEAQLPVIITGSIQSESP